MIPIPYCFAEEFRSGKERQPRAASASRRSFRGSKALRPSSVERMAGNSPPGGSAARSVEQFCNFAVLTFLFFFVHEKEKKDIYALKILIDA